MRYFLLIFALCVVLVLLIAGQRGDLTRNRPIQIFPDMKRQLRLRPQTANSFFADSLSSQLPQPGTIAQSRPMPVGGREVYPFEDDPVNTGRTVGTTNFVELNPLPVTAVLLARGRERFTIFCSACHSRTGDGNGIAKKIAVMPVVANLHDKRIVELPDGELFHTITHGKNLMGAYGSQIPVEDRWAIIAYLRALQLSWLGSVEDLSPELRTTLNK